MDGFGIMFSNTVDLSRFLFLGEDSPIVSSKVGGLWFAISSCQLSVRELTQNDLGTQKAHVT